MVDKRARLRIAGCTDTGLQRQYNQDHIGFNQNLGIAVLADGMGGHLAGEVAAQMAVSSVLEKLEKFANQETSRSITGSQLLEIVSNTISDSNTDIFQASEANEEHKGMGTTVVVTIVKGARIYAGHVGDSRLYLYRNQSVTRITKDHSLAQDLVDKGFYTEQEARTASVSHVVTRALGARAEVEVDTIQQELREKDLFLLCSDGLTDMVADWEIAQTIAENAMNLEAAAGKLVALANKYGGKDNISVILVEIQSNSEDEDVTTEVLNIGAKAY